MLISSSPLIMTHGVTVNSAAEMEMESGNGNGNGKGSSKLLATEWFLISVVTF